MHVLGFFSFGCMHISSPDCGPPRTFRLKLSKGGVFPAAINWYSQYPLHQLLSPFESPVVCRLHGPMR